MSEIKDTSNPLLDVEADKVEAEEFEAGFVRQAHRNLAIVTTIAVVILLVGLAVVSRKLMVPG